jgi:hypothetical protein
MAVGGSLVFARFPSSPWIPGTLELLVSGFWTLGRKTLELCNKHFGVRCGAPFILLKFQQMDLKNLWVRLQIVCLALPLWSEYFWFRLKVEYCPVKSFKETWYELLVDLKFPNKIQSEEYSTDSATDGNSYTLSHVQQVERQAQRELQPQRQQLE